MIVSGALSWPRSNIMNGAFDALRAQVAAKQIAGHRYPVASTSKINQISALSARGF